MEIKTKIVTDKYSEIISGLESNKNFDKMENNENFDKTEIFDAEEIIETEEVLDFENTAASKESENFDEILQLTQYSDGSLESIPNNGVVAEYNKIEIVTIQNKHKEAAKTFVNRITKFILEFNDVHLTKAHEAYLKQVGALQLQHLEDLLYLVEVNRLMLNNIIERVNVTQAEDYAIINSYNNLANQHLKLMKELQNTYKAIPNVLKRMKADILCNQELDENIEGNNGEVITEEYGTTQFNNSKQMLRTLIAKRDAEKASKNNENNTENN